MNVIGSPLDTRMGMKVAYEMGLASIAGDEKPPSPRERGSVSYPDYMDCEGSAPKHDWWELLELCEAIDEFNDTDNIVKRGNAMVTPTTNADKVVLVIRRMTKALKENRPYRQSLDGRCGTCMGHGHEGNKCPQTFARELAANVFKGRKAYNDHALECHALGACIITIAGMDVGKMYKYVSQQLYNMQGPPT